MIESVYGLLQDCRLPFDPCHVITDSIAAVGRGGVYVHCWGGVGRTGTVVGCLLADEGRTNDQVLDRLVELRAGTRKAARPIPESTAQRDVIRRRAERPRN